MAYFAGSVFAILFFAGGFSSSADEIPFDENYYPTWGGNHVSLLDQRSEVELQIDQYSGAGFSSKQDFGSGYFRMKIKIPSKNSKGIIATFYLTSVPVGQQATNHDELDFEFLGGNSMPYTLSTNVFANDTGSREQQFHLWFDPTADFHTYELLGNQHQIVFFVDDIPMRVFKNNTRIGVNYPSKSMHIESSIWNSTAWLGQTDWSQGPFYAHYRNFSIDVCKYDSSNPQGCYSGGYYWNAEKYWKLSPDQQKSYEDVRNKYMTYDYCSDMTKHFPECSTISDCFQLI